MRKCALFTAALLAAFTLGLVHPGQVYAQGVYLGAGVTFPVGDYADFGDGDGAKTGFMAIAGVEFPVGTEGLAAFGEGFFGQNSHEFEGDKTTPYGAMAGLLYSFGPEDGPGPYLFGQAGFLVHKYSSDEFPEYESSDTGFAFGGGAGYGFPLGGVDGFVEGRYMQGQFDDGNTTFFGVMAGISIAVGGGGG